jgi:MFS family permease
MFASRILSITANSPSQFFVAAIIGGIFDCFYPIMQAWLADYTPDFTMRSKVFGKFSAVVLLSLFTLGVPVGVALSLLISIVFPYYVSALLVPLCIILLIFIPIDDTLGTVLSRGMDDGVIAFTKTRGLPKNIRGFIVQHSPFSTATLRLILKANRPLLWISYFLLQTSLSTLFFIFVQYTFVAFRWTGFAPAIGILYCGTTVAIYSAIFPSKYHGVALTFYSSVLFFIGLLLLSIAGTAAWWSKYFAYPALLVVPMAGPWIPALESILTHEYPPECKGFLRK